MIPVIERLLGVEVITDQVIAMDMLVAAKSAIHNYAVAATESGTPEVKRVLIKHLHEAIDQHAKLTTYMMARGLYLPYEMPEQIQFDRTTIETALNLPG